MKIAHSVFDKNAFLDRQRQPQADLVVDSTD